MQVLLEAMQMWLGCMQEDVFQMMAYSDITALPMLLVFCLLRRSFLLPFLYTQLLRSRYHSETGKKHHQPVWKEFGRQAQPYTARLPLRMQQGINWVVRWFTTPPTATSVRSR